MKRFGYAMAFLLGMAVTLNAAEPMLIANDAKVEKLSDGFKFTEGCASDAEGNVYFTDQPNDRIHKWGVDGKLTTFLEPCGRSNGLCVAPDGAIWACADEKNELWRIDVKTKKAEVKASIFGDKLLDGPNDLWMHPKGGVYFTDPHYKRPYWKRTGGISQDKRAVYLYSSEGKITRVDDDFTQPNGIIGTPDGKKLYVADIGKKKTYQYDIQADGTLKNRKLFCEMGSDGMTIDDAGNVYLTSGKVHVYDKTGKLLKSIEVPEGPSNVCFGGKDMQTLFITARTGFYSLKMATKGVGSQ